VKRTPQSLVARVLGAALAAGAAALMLSSSRAQAPAQSLIPDKGSNLTFARCVPCHEIGHVTRTPLSRAEWQDNIKVMIARGAPLTPGEIEIIVDYLSAYYGRNPDGSPAPPPAPDPSQAGYGLAGTPAAPEGEAGRLLAANACLACHAVDKRLIGPGFVEIAARFAGDTDAAAKLATKIRAGGAGAWGPVPMPPHPGISDADLKTIVEWVLRQKAG